MMLEDGGVHPDEGTIHAWLDGALGALESARLEEHTAGCAACSARIAEARGLIAGASRVVGLLDEQPAPLIRPASTPTAGTDLSVWRMLRVTPARASIAAVLVVAVGIGLTRGHLGVDTRSKPLESAGPGAPRTVAEMPSDASAPLPPASDKSMRDSVLSSAISRRLATEQPPRTVSPAPGVAIPTPEVASAQTTNSANAEAKVLAGRASMAAQRETAGTLADRTRAGVGQLAAGAATAAERVTVAAKAADSAGRSGVMARVRGIVGSVAPGDCFRVESAVPAMWGSVRLPMIVAMDSAGADARILTPSGAETEARAFLQYNGADSALFRLRRIGFSGLMTFAATGAPRTGTIRSSGSTVALGEVAVAPTGARLEPGQAAQNRPRSPAAIPVTAHRVSCPTP